MERLKVDTFPRAACLFRPFTFQYGEIKSLIVVTVVFGKLNLHSSMERLKELVPFQNQASGHDLHSSMERLKVCAITVCVPFLFLFTFQYGEIKSWHAIYNVSDWK